MLMLALVTNSEEPSQYNTIQRATKKK